MGAWVAAEMMNSPGLELTSSARRVRRLLFLSITHVRVFFCCRPSLPALMERLGQQPLLFFFPISFVGGLLSGRVDHREKGIGSWSN